MVEGDSTSSIGFEDASNGSIEVYPNPTQNMLYVKSVPGNMINIYSISGASIIKKTATVNGATQFNVSDFDKGIYIVESNGEICKFVVN